MDIHDIKELIKAIDESTITEFDASIHGAKISIKKTMEMVQAPMQVAVSQPSSIPTAVVSAPVAVVPEVPARTVEVSAPKQLATESFYEIKAPMVGTFYASPSPDASSFVNVGDKVNETSIVCILEAMKLFNEIEADVKGEIIEIVPKNGDLVEFGQVLFKVKPHA